MSSKQEILEELKSITQECGFNNLPLLKLLNNEVQSIYLTSIDSNYEITSDMYLEITPCLKLLVDLRSFDLSNFDKLIIIIQLIFLGISSPLPSSSKEIFINLGFELFYSFPEKERLIQEKFNMNKEEYNIFSVELLKKIVTCSTK